MRDFKVSFLVYLAVFAALSFGLYLIKYEVQELQDNVKIKQHALAEEQKAIKLLRAEWAYLTRPARLEKLQARYLKLKPIKAEQTLSTASFESGSGSGSVDGASVPVVRGVSAVSRGGR